MNTTGSINGLTFEVSGLAIRSSFPTARRGYPGEAVMFLCDSSGRMHPFWTSRGARLDVRRSWRHCARTDADRDALIANMHYIARNGSAIVQVAR